VGGWGGRDGGQWGEMKDDTGLDKPTQDDTRQHKTRIDSRAQGNNTQLQIFLPFVPGAKKKRMVRTNLNVQTKWM
jgi:hypothetical protein